MKKIFLILMIFATIAVLGISIANLNITDNNISTVLERWSLATFALDVAFSLAFNITLNIEIKNTKNIINSNNKSIEEYKLSINEKNKIIDKHNETINKLQLDIEDKTNIITTMSTMIQNISITQNIGDLKQNEPYFEIEMADHHFECNTFPPCKLIDDRKDKWETDIFVKLSRSEILIDNKSFKRLEEVKENNQEMITDKDGIKHFGPVREFLLWFRVTNIGNVPASTFQVKLLKADDVKYEDRVMMKTINVGESVGIEFLIDPLDLPYGPYDLYFNYTYKDKNYTQKLPFVLLEDVLNVVPKLSGNINE